MSFMSSFTLALSFFLLFAFHIILSFWCPHLFSTDFRFRLRTHCSRSLCERFAICGYSNADLIGIFIIISREKEKRDVVEFNIGQYMMQHNMSMMAPEDALKKEQQEYIDAKNKQDVAEKQV